MKNWFSLLLTLVCAGKILAADALADFSAANKFYAEGKFSEAAAAYEKLLQTGAHSPALWFNAGNAAFKAGHLGQAIANYRRAELVSPRDAELRANLAFVRNQVPGATARESHWQYWVGSLTLNEGTVLTLFFFWALFALLAAKQLRPVLAPKLRGLTRLVSFLTVLAGTVLALQAANHFNAAVAVITVPEAAAVSGPYDDAQTVFTVRDGAELRVLDRHDDWVEAADGHGKTGWFNNKQIAILPGA